MIHEMPKYGLFRIGNISVRLPIVENVATTELLVQAVEQRLKDFEAEAGRVDTQLFALQTAFDFAAEAYRLRQEQERAEKELIKALDGVATRLRQMAAKDIPKS